MISPRTYLQQRLRFAKIQRASSCLRTPENQIGGNQKLGLLRLPRVRHRALVHGMGSTRGELPALFGRSCGQAAGVFGSGDRRGAALAGGMPAYKWIGNKILTAFQNRMLRTNFSEFHSGYRLYSTSALNQIPFEKNTNDFHFDTEIIVQFVMKNLCIAELPIPTYYGDEICHVNGMKYAWDIFKTMFRVRFHEMNLLFDRNRCHPPEQNYDLNSLPSSNKLDRGARPRHILDIGCAGLSRSNGRKGCRVTGMD